MGCLCRKATHSATDNSRNRLFQRFQLPDLVRGRFQLFQSISRFNKQKIMRREFRRRAIGAATCTVFEAKKRFGLCVLDYIVTSNHIHLLVKDTGSNVIARVCSSSPGALRRNTTNARKSRGPFGKIDTTLQLSKPTNIYIVAWFT
jgi:hypothetical protein